MLLVLGAMPSYKIGSARELPPGWVDAVEPPSFSYTPPDYRKGEISLCCSQERERVSVCVAISLCESSKAEPQVQLQNFGELCFIPPASFAVG